MNESYPQGAFVIANIPKDGKPHNRRATVLGNIAQDLYIIGTAEKRYAIFHKQIIRQLERTNEIGLGSLKRNPVNARTHLKDLGLIPESIQKNGKTAQLNEFLWRPSTNTIFVTYKYEKESFSYVSDGATDFESAFLQILKKILNENNS
jgi:hypothetical protein